MPEDQFRREPEDDASMVEIDALLDKIASSGVESLTPEESDRLERARKKLLRRNARR